MNDWAFLNQYQAIGLSHREGQQDNVGADDVGVDENSACGKQLSKSSFADT